MQFLRQRMNISRRIPELFQKQFFVVFSKTLQILQLKQVVRHLTQQLIKLQILTNEVSYERKAKEILLAMRLEHFMTKEEILEAYLNIIPYGRNANGDNIAGIETAAEGIFNVKAKDLTLPQAAYIAGIPQAPFAYTPFYNQGRGLKEPENLKPGIDRMKTVLFRMKETGYITEQQYNEAIAYDITQDFQATEYHVQMSDILI